MSLDRNLESREGACLSSGRSNIIGKKFDNARERRDIQEREVLKRQGGIEHIWREWSLKRAGAHHPCNGKKFKN